MHPPKHILDKLQELHPQVRIGWLSEELPGGSPDLSDDTENRGCFALLQLYHQRDSDRTYLTPWDSRGPVYGKPYDPLVRTPIWVRCFTKQEVFSGDVIGALQVMMTPLKERYEVSARAKGGAEATKVKDMAGQGGEYLWHRKHKRDNANNTAAKFEKPVEITKSADMLKDAYLKPAPIGAGKMS
jgi:hypothetical protein